MRVARHHGGPFSLSGLRKAAAEDGGVHRAALSLLRGVSAVDGRTYPYARSGTALRNLESVCVSGSLQRSFFYVAQERTEGTSAFFWNVFCNKNIAKEKESRMQLNVFPRNNDFGASVQTFQERVNGMLPVENDIRVASSAAEAYSMPRRPDPHYLTSSEVEQVLTMVEKEAQEQNEALLRIHSGLNRDRVQRLLELLR